MVSFFGLPRFAILRSANARTRDALNTSTPQAAAGIPQAVQSTPADRVDDESEATSTGTNTPPSTVDGALSENGDDESSLHDSGCFTPADDGGDLLAIAPSSRTAAATNQAMQYTLDNRVEDESEAASTVMNTPPSTVAGEPLEDADDGTSLYDTSDSITIAGDSTPSARSAAGTSQAILYRPGQWAENGSEATSTLISTPPSTTVGTASVREDLDGLTLQGSEDGDLRPSIRRWADSVNNAQEPRVHWDLQLPIWSEVIEKQQFFRHEGYVDADRKLTELGHGEMASYRSMPNFSSYQELVRSFDKQVRSGFVSRFHEDREFFIWLMGLLTAFSDAAPQLQGRWENFLLQGRALTSAQVCGEEDIGDEPRRNEFYDSIGLLVEEMATHFELKDDQAARVERSSSRQQFRQQYLFHRKYYTDTESTARIAERIAAVQRAAAEQAREAASEELRLNRRRYEALSSLMGYRRPENLDDEAAQRAFERRRDDGMAYILCGDDSRRVRERSG